MTLIDANSDNFWQYGSGIYHEFNSRKDVKNQKCGTWLPTATWCWVILIWFVRNIQCFKSRQSHSKHWQNCNLISKSKKKNHLNQFWVVKIANDMKKESGHQKRWVFWKGLLKFGALYETELVLERKYIRYVWRPQSSNFVAHLALVKFTKVSKFV